MTYQIGGRQYLITPVDSVVYAAHCGPRSRLVA